MWRDRETDTELYLFRTTNSLYAIEKTENLSRQYSLHLLMRERYCDMIHSALIWESESRGMISAVIRALNEQLASHDIPGEINKDPHKEFTGLIK